MIARDGDSLLNWMSAHDVGTSRCDSMNNPPSAAYATLRTFVGFDPTFPFTAILNSGQEPPPKTTAAGSQQHTAPVSSNAAGSQQHTVPVSLPFADAEATGFLASDVLSRVFGNDILAFN